MFLKQVRRKSLIRKIFLYIFLPILAIMVATIIQINLFSSVSKNVYLKNYNEYQKNISANIENYFNRIAYTSNMLDRQMMMDICYFNRDVSIYERYAFIQLVSELTDIKNTSTDIHSILFYMKKLNVVISNESIYNADEFFSKYHVYDDYPKNFWYNYDIKSINFDLLKETKLGSTAVIPMVVNSDNYLSDDNLLIFNTQSSNFNTLIKKYTNDIHMDMRLSYGGKDIYVTNNHKNNNITIPYTVTINNEFYDLAYSFDRKAFFAPFNSYIILFNSIVGIIFIVAIIFSVKNTLKLYRPFKSIAHTINRDSRSNTNITYEKIENVVNMLVDENKKMADQVANAAMVARDNFLYQLLHDESILKYIHLKDYDIEFPYKLFCVVSIKFSFMTLFYTDFSRMQQINIFNALNTLIYDKFNQEGMQSYVIKELNDQYHIIVNTDKAHVKDVEQSVKDFPGLFAVDMKYASVLVGKGNFYHHADQISASYKDAYTDIINRVSNPSNTSKNSKIYYTPEDKNKLNNYLKTSNREEAISIVEQLNQGISSENEVRNFYFQTLFLYVNFAEANEIKSELPDMDVQYHHDLSTQELKNSIVTLTNNICDYFDSNSHLISQQNIFKYIDENYAKDLYADLLANHFKISTRKFSNFFKEKFGVTFYQYLSSYRIEKSKEILLANYKMNLDEVSQLVGFRSRQTFIRMFKQREGITPTAYRDIHIKRM
ncbi:helix-turn-helix transcriptional regulator [Vallitalea pronyensis]|uniref:Helix-turn-helix transcriptional regulator n=1 Tax=Vallitalea pronyensis TaxID=1348613 RepID=A0A8J8MHC7_9FIRM|nr:helix-turn-helix domain-containing protein [Vallitalea pronyensis]QUI21619.1 helix-turn-helix transcriptional regulator [Vallitalea pronyensis]